MRTILFTIIGFISFTGTAFAQSATFSQKPFTDVPKTSADYEAIEYLRSHNVVKGHIDGTFKPDSIINRAEFVEFIINPFILDTNGMGTCIQGNVSEASNTVFFTDVKKDAWYAENVCFAKMKNIVNGYPDKTFHPTKSINFVEAAKVINNVFSLNIGAYQSGEFWYRPYVQNLSDLHAIPTNVKRLNQTLSRGDMAQIVYRLKVDSKTDANMGFNAATNSLYQRAGTSVTTTPKPPVVPNTYMKPSRRSIVDTAEARHAAHMSKYE